MIKKGTIKKAVIKKKAAPKKSSGIPAARKKSAISKKPAIKKAPAIHYVLPVGNGWVVKNSNARTFLVITDNKRQAITMARSIAKLKHTDLIVHGKDGSILVKESYAI